MLAFFRLFPLGGLELLTAPILVLVYGRPGFRLPAIVAAIVFLVCGIATLAEKMRAQRTDRATSLAEQAGWVWLPGVSAEGYRMRLKTFLQTHGWRISASSPDGEDRVRLQLRKDRCLLSLLCLRPGRAPVSADWDLLAAQRAAAGGTHAALVTTAPRPMGEAFPAGTMQIGFDDLDTLDEALGIQIVYAEYSR